MKQGDINMHLYPLLFTPIIKKMIWGQESWDISCRPNEMSIIKNGEYTGMAFETYLSLNCKETKGTRLAEIPRFPLLIKIITANEPLSIQVHPDDDYARKQNNPDGGKSEMWYILTPPTNGHLIIGLRDGVTREKFVDDLDTSYNVTDNLNYLPVKSGDMVNIPAGLVHALTPGTTLAEIQQNSDTTYRLYDYGRVGLDGKPRELHIDHGLAVADFDGRLPKGVVDSVSCPYFSVNRHILEETGSFLSNPEAFTIIINVGEPFIINYGKQAINIPPLRSVFIPAGLGVFLIQPSRNAEILFCTV
jgi:mannose-6-phosphate isomerase